MLDRRRLDIGEEGFAGNPPPNSRVGDFQLRVDSLARLYNNSCAVTVKWRTNSATRTQEEAYGFMVLERGSRDSVAIWRAAPRAPKNATGSRRAVAPADANAGALATREVVVAGLRQRALFLLARRDRDTALATAESLEKISPNDEIAQKVRATLNVTRGRLTAQLDGADRSVQHR